MEILSFKTINGPNVYNHQPIIMMKIDLQQMDDVGSHQIPHLKDQLLSILPGLQEHHCSPGKPGGFVERLIRGTYMAHVIEHVSLELSSLAGINVNFGKARAAGPKGIYNVITRFKSEEGMKECLRQAVNLVKACIEKQEFNLQNAIETICRKRDKNKLGPTTQAIVDAAVKRGIPVKRLDQNSSLMQLGYGKNRRLFQASMTDNTNIIATDLVQDKDQTKAYLSRYGVPAPQGEVVTTVEELRNVLQKLNPPYVVKPLDGHHGQGVALNLMNHEDAERAFHIAKECSKSGDILVEEMCFGQDYRVLVVNGKFIAAALRIPPTIIGDGQSTIEQLIEVANQDPRRGEGHESVLTKIEVDDSLREHLAKQAKDLTTIPKSGEQVCLRGAANLSSGGTAKDVTEVTHPEVQRICERIARLVNLDICGVDIIHRNISEPVNEFFKVIEVNAAPGLRMHLAPTEGKARPVADCIVEMLYPNNAPSRIPIAAVTGTNGKTTVSRLLKKILSVSGKTIGLTSTDGIWIGNDKIVSGDTTGPISSDTILADPIIDMAVLEVARGGIMRGGLAYDWSDVGVITNIRPDHLGQDGLEDLDDIIWVKSIVAERVRENGTLILNADDPAAVGLKDKPAIQKRPKNIMLYSTDPNNPLLQEHLAQGGNGCWTDGEWIYLKQGGTVATVLRVVDIPFTLSGTVDYQVSNALAAVAAANSMGAELSQIREGLRTFSAADNIGRLNIYKVQKGHVILDYAHNPDAILSLGKMARKWSNYNITCIAGLPGDRADHLIRESAHILGTYFDHLILRDDNDLRGRQPGEVPMMVEKEIRTFRPNMDMQIITDERLALQTALSKLGPNDVVIVLYDDLDCVMHDLKPYEPISVANLPALAKTAEVRRPDSHGNWNHLQSFQSLGTH